MLISGWDEELGALRDAIAAAHRRGVRVAAVDLRLARARGRRALPPPDQGHDPSRERRPRRHAVHRLAGRARRSGRRRRLRVGRVEQQPRVRDRGRGLPQARHLRAEDRRTLQRPARTYLWPELRPLARRLLRSRRAAVAAAPLESSEVLMQIYIDGELHSRERRPHLGVRPRPALRRRRLRRTPHLRAARLPDRAAPRPVVGVGARDRPARFRCGARSSKTRSARPSRRTARRTATSGSSSPAATVRSASTRPPARRPRVIIIVTDLAIYPPSTTPPGFAS